MNILIITSACDEHVDRVARALSETRKARVFRFDSDDYYAGKTSINLLSGESGFIETPTGRIDLDKIESVWYRKPAITHPPENRFDEETFGLSELEDLFHEIGYLIPGARWMDRPETIRHASKKYVQLETARLVGMHVPKTLFTNSPDVAAAFIHECKDRVVYKAQYEERIGVDPVSKDITIVPTSLISKADLPYLKLIKNSGGIFQEYIEKRYEIRVTIIGEHVFSARIDSQHEHNKAGSIDWRIGNLTEEFVSPYELPGEIAASCRALIKNAGLNFGAIDLIRDVAGRYVFLEINPVGQWVWIEDLTGQPMIRAMVDFLSGV